MHGKKKMLPNSQFFFLSRKFSAFCQLLESKGGTVYIIQGKLTACLYFLSLVILRQHSMTLSTENAEI